jgi:hypothetical protein
MTVHVVAANVLNSSSCAYTMLVPHVLWCIAATIMDMDSTSVAVALPCSQYASIDHVLYYQGINTDAIAWAYACECYGTEL